MKIVFFGTDNFVDPVLKILEENFQILAIRNPKDFDDNLVKKIKDFSPDLFVVASYGVIFPKSFLEIPRLGAINVHPSLLPKYRGPSPIQNTILMGDKTTGVTIIKMDEEVDHGPILYREKLEVLQSDTFETLAERLFENAAKALPETISNYKNSMITPTEQDHSKASFTQHLARQNGYVDLEKALSKDKINAMIRAYYPWPGVWTRLRLGSDGQAKLIKFLPEKKIQVEGKKEMSYEDFINGYPEGKFLLQKLSLI